MKRTKKRHRRAGVGSFHPAHARPSQNARSPSPRRTSRALAAARVQARSNSIRDRNARARRNSTTDRNIPVDSGIRPHITRAYGTLELVPAAMRQEFYRGLAEQLSPDVVSAIRREFCEAQGSGVRKTARRRRRRTRCKKNTRQGDRTLDHKLKRPALCH